MMENKLLDDLLKKYGNNFNKMINFYGEEIAKYMIIDECTSLISASIEMLKMKNYMEFINCRVKFLNESADVIIALCIYLKAQNIDLKELMETIDIRMKRKMKEITIE